MNANRFMAILISALFIQMSCASDTYALKRVECKVEIMPNYIWHLFAIANLWDIDNSPYGQEYGYSVPAEDIDFLFSNREYIIDSAFHNNHIIHSWEVALDMEYPGDGFYPVLTYANGMDNLPSANNLSDSRNNFGVPENSTQYNIDLIIHEIGVFALMPVIRSLFTDDSLQTKFIQENGIIYQAIESFIEYKKEGITGSRKVI